MSGQSLIGIAGYAAGIALAPTGATPLVLALYASGGALAGGIAGSALFPSKVSGPRLGDLSVQTSTYGAPIPIIYGTNRVAGNMIWSKPILETRHRKRVGKGGGAKQTKYTYSQSFAIALHDGPITAISRIWANGKLVYNVSTSADGNTVGASGAFASVMTIYYGSETQMPSSLIQADKGVANTPAYRGTSFVTFENLQLADYGNATPALEFEISVTPPGAAVDLTAISGTLTQPENISSVVSSGKYTYLIHPTGLLRIYDSSNPALPVLLSSTDIGTGIGYGYYSWPILVGTIIWYREGSTFKLQGVDVSDPTAPFPLPIGPAIGNLGYGSIHYQGFLYANYPAGPPSYLFVYDIRDPYNVTRVDITSPGMMQYGSVLRRGIYLYVTAGANALNIFDATDPAVPVLAATLTGGSPSWSAPEGQATIKGDYLYIADTGNIYIYSLANPLLPALAATWVIANAIYLDDFLHDSLLTFRVGATLYLYSLENPIAPVLIDSTTNATIGFIIAGTPSLLITATTTGLSFYSISSQLAAAVSNICTRAGLLTSQIDVSQLTDTLDGFTVTQSSARSQLEALMTAYYFDAVESDGKIKFVKRGTASVLTITEDELAAHEAGSEMPVSLAISRGQELELPFSVNVQYQDKDASYQIGSQNERRQITDSVAEVTLNLPLAISAAKAKHVAAVTLYAAWAARTTFAFANGWKYGYLDPCDVITVIGAGRSYQVRITGDDAAGGIFSRTAVMEDDTAYTQPAVASDMLPGLATVDPVPLITLTLLDLPLLRDSDDELGFYAAAYASNDGWRGAQLYKSADAGASWTEWGNPFTNESTVGVATTTLGNFTGKNIFDESSTVTVRLSSGELASDTEINVLNGANAALIGNEIVQFKTATLTAANTYTLSGMLRGRLGTEWAMTTHTSSDRFVLLDPTMIYLESGLSAEYNLSRSYLASAVGGYLDDALTQNFTNTGIAQECYAPVELGGGRNAALDVTLTWVRRTRIGGGWLDNADVVLGEDTEAYEVEIYSSAAYSTLKRTITAITTPTTSYTAAQQTTDFGSTQATVYFIVYQLSATVGRGYEARGVI